MIEKLEFSNVLESNHIKDPLVLLSFESLSEPGIRFQEIYGHTGDSWPIKRVI